MAAAPRSASSSAEAVYLALRGRFADGGLAPGERLTEASLAQELGVSRTPVREALGRLLADGLVVPTARGVAVAAMIAYHGSWDLSFFRLIPTDIVGHPAWQFFARAIAASFLILVGISWRTSQR